MSAGLNVLANEEPQLSSALEASLAVRKAYERGQLRWPRIQLSYERFCSHVVDNGLEHKVEFAADLYVSVACLQRCGAAHRAIESEYFPAVRSLLVRLLGHNPVVDDVLQDIRARLFVGCRPKIASYRGAGPLCGWLRRVAMHAAQDWMRSRNAEAVRVRRIFSEQRLSGGSQVSGEELERQAFRVLHERIGLSAWVSAIRALNTSERTLLFDYFVSGLSIDVIGAMHSVHRATIARRVRRVVNHVKQGVKKSLDGQGALNDGDLQAFLLHSLGRLDLSSLLESDNADARWSEKELETASVSTRPWDGRYGATRSESGCTTRIIGITQAARVGGAGTMGVTEANRRAKSA